MRTINWHLNAWEDYLHWQGQDKRMVKRINALIKDILRTPYDGIGKPEPLKFQWSGYWSRRINGEHRLVYTVRDNDLIIAQCRYHYGEHGGVPPNRSPSSEETRRWCS